MNASVNDAKAMRKSTAREIAEREKLKEQKRLAQIEKLKKQGLAGQKLGRHKVPEGRVEVQLGEDLSENLRGLKVWNIQSHCFFWPPLTDRLLFYLFLARRQFVP